MSLADCAPRRGPGVRHEVGVGRATHARTVVVGVIDPRTAGGSRRLVVYGPRGPDPGRVTRVRRSVAPGAGGGGGGAGRAVPRWPIPPAVHRVAAANVVCLEIQYVAGGEDAHVLHGERVAVEVHGARGVPRHREAGIPCVEDGL